MPSTENKRIAKNTLFLYLRMGINLVVALYTTRMILQILGVEDYGIYNVVCGFVSMFTFLNGSMTNGIQRFYNFELGRKDTEKLNTVFNNAIIIQFILAVIIIIAAETIGIWFFYNKMVIPEDRMDAAFWIFQMSIVSFFIVIMQVPFNSAIIAHEKMQIYAYISIIEVFGKLGIVYLLQVINYDKLIVYGGLYLIITIIIYLINYLYSKKSFQEIKFRFKLDKKLFLSMLSFSGWNIFGSVAHMLKGQGLNVLLNMFFGTVVNAARGISYQILSALQGFIANIQIAAKPQMVQSYACGDTGRTFNLMYSLSKISFILMFMLAFPIMLEIDYVLNLWLGDNVPENTSVFTIIVICISLISNLNAPVSFVVHATGKMKKYQVITSIVSLLILPVSYLFLKLGYEAVSVFFVSLAFTVLNQIISLLILRTLVVFSIKEYVNQVIIPICYVTLLSCIFPILLSVLIDQSFICLICVCLSSLLCVSITSYYFAANSNEKEIIKTFVGKYCKMFKLK